MVNRFKAAFQFRIGLVQRLEAAWIARYTTFSADSSCGNILRLRVAWRITLFNDSIGKGDATLISLCQNIHPHAQDIDKDGSGVLAVWLA